MELKDSVRVMTKEEFESAINEDIKFVEGIKHFFKHDDATRVMEHVKSVLEASVDYHYPNHPEPEAEPGDMGEVSDGYHTFNELYRYRMLYNAAFFNLLARNGQVEVCKSRKHSDGEKCFGSDDWFIVMAILPTGQVSNHYESKYWDLFDVPERETAFEYDGHTPNEAADRIEKYLKLPCYGMTFEKALESLKLGHKIKRTDWGGKYIQMFVSYSNIILLMVDTDQKSTTEWIPSYNDIVSNDWIVLQLQ